MTKYSPMIIKTCPVGELQTNCYLVADEATREGVIIDPGADAQRILEAVKAENIKVMAMLITHGHFDHVGAARDIQDALGPVPIWCHEADVAWVLDAVNQGRDFGVRVERAPEKVDFHLVEGETVCLGALNFRVLHTPGHSPGGVTLVAGKHAFTGDTLFAGGIGRSDFDGGSHRQLLDSIRRKLYSLDDDVAIYPGHGPSSSIGEEKRSNPFVRHWNDN